MNEQLPLHFIIILLLLFFLPPQSLAFYKENQDITKILDNMDVYVLPVLNPDGYKYTWTTVRALLTL